MTEDKTPYIQCLYHTGKKVYKYWIAILAAIGVLIGIGYVVLSAWKLIVDGYNYFITTIIHIVYVLTNLFNNAWSIACSVAWYWWVIIGVIVGPFILVVIWCALKRYNVKNDDIISLILSLVTIVTGVGILNFGCDIIVGGANDGGDYN